MEIREAKSELRRWCPYMKTHQDADDPVCGWLHSDYNNRSHRLRRRRMVVCSQCGQGYFTRQEFDDHECYSAY